MKAVSSAIGIVLAIAVLPGAALAFDPTDPLDGARDSDGDGLSNYREFLLGTDPSNPDSDGGGATDGWEADHGLNPNDRSDDLADTDGDGWSNYREFIVGTDPRNPDTDGDTLKDSVDPHPLVPDCDFVGEAGSCRSDGGDGVGPGPGPGIGDGTGGGAGSGQGSGSGGQGSGEGNGQGQGAGQGAGSGSGNGQGGGMNGGGSGTPGDADGDGIVEGGVPAPSIARPTALPSISLPHFL